MQPTEDSRSQTRKQGKAKTARLATHAIAALQPEGICPLTHGIGGWRHSTFPVSPPSAEPTSPTAVAPPHWGPERPKLRAVASPPTLPQHALPTSEGQIVPPCPQRAPPTVSPAGRWAPPRGRAGTLALRLPRGCGRHWLPWATEGVGVWHAGG